MLYLEVHKALALSS